MNKSSVSALMRCAGAFALGTAFVAGPALAGAGDIYTTVKPLATNVTYSSADGSFVAYIGFEVSLGSAATTQNTVNDVVFTGTLAATDTAEKATVSAVYGPTCTADGASVRCPIGQLRAGQTYPTFAIFFKVPAQVVQAPPLPPVADAPGTDFLTFSGTSYYAEGTGGVPQSPPANSTVPWSAAAVLMGTSNPTEIRSSVPKSGGKFYTGTGISTAGDPFATEVTVPSADFYTGESWIIESTFGLEAGCVNFTPCYAANVNVPGTFAHLSIQLRQDKSTIKPGTKIESVQIYYVPSVANGETFPAGYLGDCASPTTPPAGANDPPCIAYRKHYKNNKVPGWTPALDGDFEWGALANKNGGYRIE